MGAHHIRILSLNTHLTASRPNGPSSFAPHREDPDKLWAGQCLSPSCLLFQQLVCSLWSPQLPYTPTQSCQCFEEVISPHPPQQPSSKHDQRWRTASVKGQFLQALQSLWQLFNSTFVAVSDCRQYENKGVWLCSNKTFIPKPGSGQVGLIHGLQFADSRSRAAGPNPGTQVLMSSTKLDGIFQKIWQKRCI